MAEASADRLLRLNSRSGLRAEINSNGSVRRLDCGPITLQLFVGNELEGGPANLYLRRQGGQDWIALLGPSSPTTFETDPTRGMLVGTGSWRDIDYSIALVLAQDLSAWFWHVQLENTGATAQTVDLTYAQDISLAPYGAIRMNEFYVSQYLDHTPLQTPEHGSVVATRQNQAADGKHPWSLIGSLRRTTSFATDALQFHGLAGRSGETPPGLLNDLPSKRLQHEHALVALRDAPLELAPKQRAATGFYGVFVADHPQATSPADIQWAEKARQLPEATAPQIYSTDSDAPRTASLFSAAPVLASQDLSRDALQTLFGTQWRHEEVDAASKPLAFFCGQNSHVTLRAKELQVQRPHGHLLRTGRNMTPDETALTSTCWMTGVFHSMVTEGHVSINRFLSTAHSYLSLFRSHGLRVFVQDGKQWLLLQMPSAFEMTPGMCRWIYRHAKGEIQVISAAKNDPHELTLSIEVTNGSPARFLISSHIALYDDDGSTPAAVDYIRNGNELIITTASNTELGRRFSEGSFRIAGLQGTEFEQVGTDELLFLDNRSRQQPFICIVTAPSSRAGISIRGNLVERATPAPLLADTAEELTPRLHLQSRAANSHAAHLARMADIAPWFAQNAFIHYLSPRGLEQYSGGGWGTRDVCQGPVELLLALGRIEPIRDLLIRVMGNQNPDGDWPQWFMFFDRERGIRAGDSHGDIVFWPLVVLAQYLTVSGDAALLDERVRFFDSRSPDQGENASVWEHAQRALALIEKRVVRGTSLAAYGHGDWNDSLQPADPAMRDNMCSAWTVTLHYQALVSLAGALRGLGRTAEADKLDQAAVTVKADFQRLLVVDGVLTGYALFEAGKPPRYLLHPKDQATGVHYSSLAMIHAILEDLFTPEQVTAHLQLIDRHLSTADGVRLFDKPLPYRGGPQRLFQRAETATFFGREIGLMYMHAHLRFAQALAHVGQAEKFFHALCQANPIGIRSIVPTATLRQANCYYSSSDAAFADRYKASEEYDRIAKGTIALDGGWRVYSSGAGIALGLIVRRFLGVSPEAKVLRVDPVIPPALDGLRVQTTLLGKKVQLRYQVRGSGAGVGRISLNDTAHSFELEPNPYRRGAALVPLDALVRQLGEGENVLNIEVGG